MNLQHLVVEDTVKHYINTGISLRRQIDEHPDDMSIYQMYSRNMKELLTKTIQNHNNIVARTEILVSSSSVTDEDDVTKMKRLFMDKLINKIDYEALCLIIELINRKLDIEEFRGKLNKLCSKEVLDFVDDTMKKIEKMEG